MFGGWVRLVLENWRYKNTNVISSWQSYIICYCALCTVTVVPILLTHWGRDKMAAISQTTISDAFFWIKMFEFPLIFHWSLFPMVQLTIYQRWFRQWLGAVQATSHYLNQWWLVHWRIYASLGLNELRKPTYTSFVAQLHSTGNCRWLTIMLKFCIVSYMVVENNSENLITVLRVGGGCGRCAIYDIDPYIGLLVI